MDGTLLALRTREMFTLLPAQDKPRLLEQPYWRKPDHEALSMFNMLWVMSTYACMASKVIGL